MFNKNSITYKYLKASIFIVIIPILFANIVLNRLYLNISLGGYSDRIMQNLQQLSEEVNNEIKKDTSLAISIANDSEINILINDWSKDENYNFKSQISKQVQNKLNYLSEIDTVVFLFKGKGMYYYKGKPSISEAEIRKNCLVKTRSNKDIEILYSLIGITDTSRGKYIRSMVVYPDTGYNKNNIEAIFFSFDSSVFSNIDNFRVFGNSGQVFVSDLKGNILLSQKKNQTSRAFEDTNLLAKSEEKTDKSHTFFIDGKKTFVSSFTNQDYRLKIYGLVNYKDLTRDISKILNFAIVFSIFIIVLFLVFSFLFLRDILIPVHNLNKKMKIVEKGYFDTHIEIRGNDEINNLGKSFNRMVSEIRKLIGERDTKEKEKEKAEIEALQSQINPHFISNTLNSIRLMAMMAKADSIKNMTEAFMKLLTSTFSRKGIFNTLETETEILKSYIYIMNVRFGDKFDVEFDIGENVRQYYLLKLVLQPILENAILHGISDMKEKGLISIKGYKLNEDLVVEIIDNGKGMTKEELNDLMSEGYRNTKGFNGMGLMNVDKRIRLNHGDRYGLKIESVFGEYTNVKILLPIILFEHGGISDV